MDRKTILLKISILPNLIYVFNVTLIKIPASYFVDINKLILKFMWESKRPRIANTILKENKVGGLMPPKFKTYYTAVVLQAV